MVACHRLSNADTNQSTFRFSFYDRTNGESVREPLDIPANGSASTQFGTVEFTRRNECNLGSFDGSFTRLAGVATGSDGTEYPAYWDEAGNVTLVAGSPVDPDAYAAIPQKIVAVAFPPGSETLWWIEDRGAGSFVLHQGDVSTSIMLPDAGASFEDSEVFFEFSLTDPAAWRVASLGDYFVLPGGTLISTYEEAEPPELPPNTVSSGDLPASEYSPLGDIVIATDGSAAYFVACQCSPASTPFDERVESLWSVPTGGGIPTKVADVDARGGVVYVGPVNDPREAPSSD